MEYRIDEYTRQRLCESLEFEIDCASDQTLCDEILVFVPLLRPSSERSRYNLLLEYDALPEHMKGVSIPPECLPKSLKGRLDPKEQGKTKKQKKRKKKKGRKKSTNKNTVQIYTDGSCYPNPGPGGWGALLQYRGRERTMKGGQSDTTNNRMELTATIKALEVLKYPCNVVLFTDSKYVQQGISTWIKGWRNRGWVTKQGDPVKNQDLWRQLDALCASHSVDWCWVRGHAGHEGNERADTLAVQGRAEHLAKC